MEEVTNPEVEPLDQQIESKNEDIHIVDKEEENDMKQNNVNDTKQNNEKEETHDIKQIEAEQNEPESNTNKNELESNTNKNEPESDTNKNEDIMDIDKEPQKEEPQNTANKIATNDTNDTLSDVEMAANLAQATQMDHIMDHIMHEDEAKTNRTHRRLRREKMKEDEEEEEEEDENNKTPLFPVDKELQLTALQRVFEGTHTKFKDKTDSFNKTAHNKAEPTEPLYCVCRRTYQEDDFMIMCDLCEEWFHGYCVAIKEDDAEDIEEYDCFLCCGYRTPKKGISYNKLDPRNTIQQRFKSAKKNRQMIAQQIRIENPSIKSIKAPNAQKQKQKIETKLAKIPKKKKVVKVQEMIDKKAVVVLSASSIKAKAAAVVVEKAAKENNVETQLQRRALRRPKPKAIAILSQKQKQKQKRDRIQFEREHIQLQINRSPPKKKRKMMNHNNVKRSGPPQSYLPDVPPLEIPDLDAKVSQSRSPPLKYASVHSRSPLKYASDHPFYRAPSAAHAPPQLPHLRTNREYIAIDRDTNRRKIMMIKKQKQKQKQAQKQRRISREISSNEWRERIRERVKRRISEKIGSLKAKKLESYLFQTYGGGSKMWNANLLEHLSQFHAVASSKRKRRRESAHCEGNMYVNKMYDVLDKLLEFNGILKIIQIGSIDAKDILYIGDNAIREKIRESDPNYKILCKLATLLQLDQSNRDSGIKLAEEIIFEAKRWSATISKKSINKLGNRNKEFLNKMRDLMYNLRKNKKLLASVQNGELSALDLVCASAEQLANDKIVKQRREIRENTLKERVLTENLDKLKRDSYHTEKSKILNFEDKKKGVLDTDYDITTDAVLVQKQKKKKLITINESDNDSSDDSDDDLAIAHNLKKVEYEKELKKKQISKLLARANKNSNNNNNNNNATRDDKSSISLIIKHDEDDSEDDDIMDEDDDIHEIKVIGGNEEDDDDDDDDMNIIDEIATETTIDTDLDDNNNNTKVVSFALDRNEIKIQSDHDDSMISDENEHHNDDDEDENVIKANLEIINLEEDCDEKGKENEELILLKAEAAAEAAEAADKNKKEIETKQDDLHLIWKGKISHNEVFEGEDDELIACAAAAGDILKCFGVKIYQIGGEFIFNLPAFQDIKHKRNEMFMTGRIKHAELEKYILKQVRNTQRTQLICCKITISKDIHEATKLIKHLKVKERCARFKMGHKSEKNYFDFYMIPPTKSNKYLNAKFVERNFKLKGTKISNKKMWGLCVLPMSSFNKVKKNKKKKKKKKKKTVLVVDADADAEEEEESEDDDDDDKKEENNNNNVLDDESFFTNLQTITSLLGVDDIAIPCIQENNNDTKNDEDENDTKPIDPRKRH